MVMIKIDLIDKISINQLQDSAIYFESHIDDVIELFLYSEYLGENIYHHILQVNKGVTYYVSHPSIICLDEIKIRFRFRGDDNLYEGIITKDLLKTQPKHMLNMYTDVEYDKIKPYINWTYQEVIYNDNYELHKFSDSLKGKKLYVMDLGANIGLFAKYLEINGYDIDFYCAVEPQDRLNPALDINLNNLDHIVINKALNISNKKISMDIPKSVLKSAISSESMEGTIVDTITISELIDHPIDILKVDVEGAEKYLCTPTNINIIKENVRYILMETHGDEVDKLITDSFYNDFDLLNTNRVGGLNHHIFINKKESTKKKILVKVSCPALGDTLCSTPTIRKISYCYGQKIDVMTKRMDVFEDNPYVNNILPHDENLDISLYNEVFETYNQHIKFNKNMDNSSFYDKSMEVKLSNFEARQLHALGAGITLYPEEMGYDYKPKTLPSEDALKIDDRTIILHITENWPSRTWSVKKWQRLVNLIKNNTDFKIATIGKSHIEDGYFGDINKNIIKLDNIDYDFCDDNIGTQNQSSELRPISEMWHMLSRAFALVSFDSGPIHLAGTTDTHIIQIGSSIRYEKTAPYRNGSQLYKYHFVSGECKIFCATDPKYSVKEWGTINSMPYYPECQEKYTEFKCQPTVDKIFFKILEIYNVK